MDDFAKNILLFALGVGVALALFYVWEKISDANCNGVTGKIGSINPGVSLQTSFNVGASI